MSAVDIEQRIANIQSEPGFDAPNMWLTFYLAAAPQCLNASMPQCLNASMPQCLDALAEELIKLQGVNLGDGEGGFLYPKLPVPNSTADIVALIERVRNLAQARDVEVIAVDADTTPDPSTSRFAEIIHYDRNVS